MTTVGATVLNVATTLVLSPPAIAAILMIAVFFVALLFTWAALRTIFSSQAEALAASEGVILVQLQAIGGASVLVVLNVPLSVVNGVASVVQLVSTNIDKIAAVVIAALAATAYLQYQPQISDAWFSARQCFVQPTLETFLFPFVNLARLLYASLWPIVNVGAQYWWFITAYWYRLLFLCSTPADVFFVFQTLGRALGQLVTSLADWMTSGFLDNRMEFGPTLLLIGTAANAALPPLNCFCAFLGPLWSLLAAIPQDANLQTAIDAALNAVIRLAQMLLYFLILDIGNLQTGNVTEEANAAVIATGEAAQDIVSLTVNMFFGILDEIGALSLTSASAGLLSIDEAEAASPDARAYALAAALQALPPLTGNGSGRVNAQTPLWQEPGTGSLINATLGAQQILQLVATPWAGIWTYSAAAIFSFLNMTAMAVTHPTCINILGSTCDCVFDGPRGLQYLQFGFIFDNVRNAIASLVSLTVIVDANMPSFLSLLGNYVAFMVQSLPEMFVGLLYTIVFPPYVPTGLPFPECDTCLSCNFNCTACPAGWTLFEFFPYYFNWTHSCVNEARVALGNSGNALANILGTRRFIYDRDPSFLHIKVGILVGRLTKEAQIVGEQLAEAANGRLFKDGKDALNEPPALRGRRGIERCLPLGGRGQGHAGEQLAKAGREDVARVLVVLV